jgi:uncharacterized membrane protein YkoI
MKVTRKPGAAIGLLLFAGFGASTALAGEDESSPTAAEAKISQEQAEKIALAQVPGGTVKEAELEREHGKLVWSFDIATADSRHMMDVEIDAETGAVLEVEKD